MHLVHEEIYEVVLDDVGKEMKEQKHGATFESEEMRGLHVTISAFPGFAFGYLCSCGMEERVRM